MLMGEHIPLCLLAGVGAAYLVRRWTPRPPLQAAVLALLVLASFPSNALFLSRDIHHLEDNHSETGLPPYLPNTLYDAYGWIRRNLDPRSDAVLGFPTDCAPLPGATDRVVWCGHWAETPAYGTKLQDDHPLRGRRRRPTPNAPPSSRSIPATYLLYPNDVSHGRTRTSRQRTSSPTSPTTRRRTCSRSTRTPTSRSFTSRLKVSSRAGRVASAR